MSYLLLNEKSSFELPFQYFWLEDWLFSRWRTAVFCWRYGKWLRFYTDREDLIYRIVFRDSDRNCQCSSELYVVDDASLKFFYIPYGYQDACMFKWLVCGISLTEFNWNGRHGIWSPEYLKLWLLMLYLNLYAGWGMNVRFVLRRVYGERLTWRKTNGVPSSKTFDFPHLAGRV